MNRRQFIRTSAASSLGLLLSRRYFGLYAACLILAIASMGGAMASDVRCWSEAAAHPDPRFDPIRQLMRSNIRSGKASSIAVSVAVGGVIVWEDACGMANREDGIRATPNTSYDIGSISKTFTATALMTLVQSGRVALDRPANDYLGNAKLHAFVGDANAATVELVMQHRAGLPMHSNFIRADEAYHRPDINETIRRYGIIVRTPGETFNYANLGYGVIEAIIEHVSGQPYRTLMRRSVFLPLGLTHTSVGALHATERTTAVPYDDGGKRLPRMDLDQRGAGYVYSSAHDLARFGMFHLKDRLPGQRPILSDRSIDMMVDDHKSTHDDSSYGLGWDIDHDTYGTGLTSVRHTGAQAGFAGVLKLIPQKNIVVAVLANSEHSGTINLSERIVSILLPAYGVKRDAALKVENAPAPQKEPSPQFVGGWKGTVATWGGKVAIEMRVRVSGDITVKYGNHPEGPFYHTAFRSDEMDGSFAGTIPTLDAMRDKHTVYLDRMIVRGDTMYGTAIADAGLHYALPSFITMTRQPVPR
jgi:CubicO group peptidase (beta-lactamase class C family)